MSIRVLIIEDEVLAVEKLIRQLKRIDAPIQVVATCESIKKGTEILGREQFDLIISDIHLTDGLSFQIFLNTKVDTPVIFATAYDQYAIEAFKTNSIDYLLKPITQEALQNAIEKYLRLNPSDDKQHINFELLLQEMTRTEEKYKTRFLVQSGSSELKSVGIDEVAYFYADGKYTFIVCKNGREYFADNNLGTLYQSLDPKMFFQINRKFIMGINSIEQIIKYSKSRFKVKMNPPTKQDAIVSTDRSSAFKNWLGR